MCIVYVGLKVWEWRNLWVEFRLSLPVLFFYLPRRVGKFGQSERLAWADLLHICRSPYFWKWPNFFNKITKTPSRVVCVNTHPFLNKNCPGCKKKSYTEHYLSKRSIICLWLRYYHVQDEIILDSWSPNGVIICNYQGQVVLSLSRQRDHEQKVAVTVNCPCSEAFMKFPKLGKF